MAAETGMRATLEEHLRDLILAEAAPSPLAEIAVVQRGYDPNPPLYFYPLIEIFTEARRRVSEETGYETFAYPVHIGVSVLNTAVTNPHADDARKADVQSYQDCGRYVAALKDLLLKHLAADAASYTDADGFVETAWYLDYREDSAGVETRSQAVQDFGRVTFEIQTRQLRG